MSMFCSSSSPKASSSFASSKVFGTTPFVRRAAADVLRRRKEVDDHIGAADLGDRALEPREVGGLAEEAVVVLGRSLLHPRRVRREERDQHVDEKAFVSENRSALDARRWLSICSKYTRPWPTYSPSAVRVSRESP